ncbi:hypothetical protein BKP45_02055 [Anaerobacillus alkalidiazotrophicus]|uniref:Major facilitator superfamily (MFS) profile domain-containing protein n=1 Tax=Anaerobacillus alkalidiazotrophicus TaxID=472963 RepID=A0A1S2MAF1_9BACI|nr:MFS transporter [Anaerobacillus alkalidiazotrophicus]OIJ21546.1 hypothetical protein BKP45_02055 [Anaerobacillus alkalidiazotrophicus]
MDNLQFNKKDYSMFHIITFFSLTAIFIVSNLYIMIPLLDSVSITFSISTTQASLSISAFSFFYAFGLIFFGSLSERFGLKETISVGLFILTILMIVSYYISNFSAFLILRGFQGFWAATFAPVSFIYIFNVLSLKHQGITIAVINTGFLSAGVVGQLFSSSIHLFWGWEGVFISLSLLYLFLFIYSLKCLPRPTKPAQSRSVHLLIRTLLKIPFRKDLRKLYFITFTILLTFVAYYTALENYYSTILGLPPENTLVIRSFGLTGLLLTILSNKISGRIGFENTIFMGLTLMLTGVLCSTSSIILFLIFGSVIFVAGTSITIPSLIYIISIKGAENKSLAISMYSFILLIGASFGSGITIITNYYAKLAFLSLILLCSLLSILMEKRSQLVSAS